MAIQRRNKRSNLTAGNLVCQYKFHVLTILTAFVVFSSFPFLDFSQPLLLDPAGSTLLTGSNAISPVGTPGGLLIAPYTAVFDPPKCTFGQLQKVLGQLPAEQCVSNIKSPWNSGCSLSAATRSCPEAPWLDRHLGKPQPNENSFLSFFVGSNKAIDAVPALQIESRNPRFDVPTWKTTLAKGHKSDFAGSSCAQFHKEYHAKSQEQLRDAQVYCFEPVGSTFTELSQTKVELGWTNQLILEEAALLSHSGTISVPKTVPLGQENKGINELNCIDKMDNSQHDCRMIPIYTLNHYVGSLADKPQIHFLFIDVEGYDFEVLKGASAILEEQVQYLEFEYNWKGPCGK
jgi:FkbM family methyltransferase